MDQLFQAIENLVEIKDTELNHFEPVGTHILQKNNEILIETLDVSSTFLSLENKYKQVCWKFKLNFFVIFVLRLKLSIF